MKRKIFVSVIIALIFIAVLIPFLLIKGDSTASLKLSTDLISAISSLLTLIIAVLVYNKYVLDDSLLVKQSEVVLELASEVKKMHFLLRGQSNYVFLRLDIDLAHYRDYENKELIFGNNYMIEISKVLEIGRSIFLPKEIAHKVANLEVSILQSVEFDSNKHLRVCSLSGKDEMFGVINQKVTTFKDFTQTWEELIASVEGWIKSNVSNPIELNLRKVHASR